MKRLIWKLLTLQLALLLLLTLPVQVLAAALEPGVPLEYTLEPGTSGGHTFTPREDGLYRFSLDMNTPAAYSTSSYLDLYEPADDQYCYAALSHSWTRDNTSHARDAFWLTAGHTYRILNQAILERTTRCSLTVQQEALPELTPGCSLSLSASDDQPLDGVFLFTAPHAGTYRVHLDGQCWLEYQRPGCDMALPWTVFSCDERGSELYVPAEAGERFRFTLQASPDSPRQAVLTLEEAAEPVIHYDDCFLDGPMATVRLGSTVRTVSPYALTDRESLKEIVVDPRNSWLSSRDGVLYNRNQTTLLAWPSGKPDTVFQIPNGVQTLGYRSISSPSIKTLILPYSLRTIETDAISCPALTDLSPIPARVQITANPFRDCGQLKAFSVAPGSQSMRARDGLLFSRDGKTLLAWPNGKPFDGALLAGSTTIGSLSCSGVSAFPTGEVIPDGVTAIENKAFAWNSHLAGPLVLPESLRTIGDYAFAGCSGLTGPLTLPHGLTSLGSQAFERCSGLTGSLTLPDGLRTIEGYTFAGCSGLTGPLTLPDGLTRIGDFAFSRCSGFTGPLVLPDGLTDLGFHAFSDCSGFTGCVSIPANVRLSDNPFPGCTGLTGFSVDPRGTAYREQNGAILSADGKTLLVWPGGKPFDGALVAGITAVGPYACVGLPADQDCVTVPDGVRVLDLYAFSGENLHAIVLPLSVTILNIPFYRNLERIYYAGTEEQWWQCQHWGYYLGAPVKFQSTGPLPRFTVSYDLRGGRGEMPQARAYEVGDSVTPDLFRPYKYRYHFLGWARSDTGELITEPFPMPDHDLVLQAQYCRAPWPGDRLPARELAPVQGSDGQPQFQPLTLSSSSGDAVLYYDAAAVEAIYEAMPNPETDRFQIDLEPVSADREEVFDSIGLQLTVDGREEAPLTDLGAGRCRVVYRLPGHMESPYPFTVTRTDGTELPSELVQDPLTGDYLLQWDLDTLGPCLICAPPMVASTKEGRCRVQLRPDIQSSTCTAAVFGQDGQIKGLESFYVQSGRQDFDLMLPPKENGDELRLFLMEYGSWRPNFQAVTQPIS